MNYSPGFTDHCGPQDAAPAPASPAALTSPSNEEGMGRDIRILTEMVDYWVLNQNVYIDRGSELDESLKRLRKLLAAQPAEPAPKLQVWYGPMPESNGKSNFTAILHKGCIFDGITIDQSEYPDRVRYEADRMRWMIGEIDAEPDIMAYDADKHSGYVAPAEDARASRPYGGDPAEPRDDSDREPTTGANWQPPAAAEDARASRQCSECKGTGVSDGRDGALIPCFACSGKSRQQGALSEEEITTIWLNNGGSLSGNNYHAFARAILSRASSPRAEAQAVPEGWKLVPAEIIDKFPELNTSNYSHDDVDELNAWGIELVLAAAEEQAVPGDNDTPQEILCSRLIDAWCDANGGQIPWDKAIEITAITTKMPDAERLRLLSLDDDGAVPADRRTADLAALVRHLAYQLRKAAPDNDLANRAADYLKREGLQGSPMRLAAAEAPNAGAGDA